MLSKLNTDMPFDLTIPKIQALSNITITWLGEKHESTTKFPPKISNAESNIYFVDIQNFKILTDSSDKIVYQLELNVQDDQIKYEAGDTFGIICKNLQNEIDEILERLDLIESKYLILEVSYIKIPINFHEYSPYKCCLNDLFTFIYDIRALPKKSFLRALADYTHDTIDRQRILQLCSKEGLKEFEDITKNINLSFIHILRAFPSCQPPLDLILENLPPLHPRAYSFASSQLASPGTVKFVFTLVTLPADECFPKPRHGLCTGHLLNLCNSLSITKGQKCLMEPKVPIFKRSNPFFKMLNLSNLPKNSSGVSSPISNKITYLFLAPGTGIAPFLSFFDQISSPSTSQNVELRAGRLTCWLLYGCRNASQDFLFKDEIYGHMSEVEKGVPPVIERLYMSFSRSDDKITEIVTLGEGGQLSGDSDTSYGLDGLIKSAGQLSISKGGLGDRPKYIQDNLWAISHELVPMILAGGVVIYLTGDARGISRSIRKCLSEMLNKHTGWDIKTCDKYVKKMQMEKRFLEDTWL